jgi:choline dehydrogenase-like flavoprotein
MIRAGDSLPDGGATEVDVAIVGAGAVGIAIATRLAGRVPRVALIEAGGVKSKFHQNLDYFKASHVADARHAPTELYRRRMLGGTTSVWGGRCIPFDPEDFAPACARSGWPIAFADVDAYVADALEFLDAGAPEFSVAAALPTHAVRLDRSRDDLVIDRIERFSKPTNVWRKWGTALARCRGMTVIHGAACTNILSNTDGTRAIGLDLKTASHRTHRIVAPTIVLACGGLETPRLLLASRGSRRRGLGNEHDLVGRFFMTHLFGSAGVLRFAAAETARAFDYGLTPDGVYGRRLILLSPAARRRHRICNIVFRPTIVPIGDPSHKDPILSAMFLAKRFIIPEYTRRLGAQADGARRSRTWRGHAANIFFGLPELAAFCAYWTGRRVLATRKLPSVVVRRPDNTYPLEFNAEHMPRTASRVLLSCRETDPLGIPRLVVQWRVHGSEINSICRGYRILAAAVAGSGLGTVHLGSDLEGIVQRTLVAQVGHHIGTARMGADPRSGVVDPNAEVWDTRGLFVSGSAIFPTSGAANPTLTAVALAFRLAEYLVHRYAAASAPIGPGPT